jgi:hypothetical protein
VVVEAVELLVDRDTARLAHDPSQLCLGPDGVVKSARSWHGKDLPL